MFLVPSSLPNASRTSAAELQIVTPSEPAPSTGLTTALKRLAADASIVWMKASTSSCVCASRWCTASQPADRIASLCRYLLRRSSSASRGSESAAPPAKAAESSACSETPGSEPTKRCVTPTPLRAASVLATRPSCWMVTSQSTSSPAATSALTLSGIVSEKTRHSLWRVSLALTANGRNSESADCKETGMVCGGEGARPVALRAEMLGEAGAGGDRVHDCHAERLELSTAHRRRTGSRHRVASRVDGRCRL
mmetsp:Transcript_19451/g.63099  ORF Transcript_19451/g.63099 Transcript_19451/m.63099 type:complete len:252 (-) Transcript_19451:81-836(-)